MKKWYINLHWFKKILTHFLMLFLFLATSVGVAETDSDSLLSDIFLAIWLLIIVLEILLLKWSGRKYRKLKTKKTKHEETSVTQEESKPIPREIDSTLNFHEPIKNTKRTHSDKVRITDDSDGHSEEYAGYYKITDPDHCLYVETGKTYHTHVGCYLNWDEDMQANFEGWRLTTIEKAQSNGLRKCRFCEESDLSPEEKFKRKYGDRPFITTKLIKTGRKEIQENLNTQNKLESATILFDSLSNSLNDSYMVIDTKFGNTLGYLSQSTINKLKKISDDLEILEAVTLEPTLNDNLACEIEIIIFTDV